MTAPHDIAALIARARQNPAPLSAWESDFLDDIERSAGTLSDAQVKKLHEIAERIDIAAMSAMLAERIRDLAETLAGEPSHRGSAEWRYRGRDGGNDALRVFVNGPKRGGWRDYHADEYGDALDLIAHLRRETRADAVQWALGWLGLTGSAELRPMLQRRPAPPEPPREASPPATLELARTIWREAQPARGTLVETYLISRRVWLPADAPIRFHPEAWRNPKFGPRGPAMIALMTNPATGEPCGAHVTYLRPDGSGKAEGERQKIMLGAAGCIRLVPDEEVTIGLGIAEGIETSLSVMLRYGWSPVWAATSAGAIARFPVLPGIEALTIFADRDAAGAVAAERCAARWTEAGREVQIVDSLIDDFNTMIREPAA